MAWQTAHLMDLAPGGSCSGVRHPEQSTSINIFATEREGVSFPLETEGREIGVEKNDEDLLEC